MVELLLYPVPIQISQRLSSIVRVPAFSRVLSQLDIDEGYHECKGRSALLNLTPFSHRGNRSQARVAGQVSVLLPRHCLKAHLRDRCLETLFEKRISPFQVPDPGVQVPPWS